MKVFHADAYFADIGPHVMPMRKFGLVAAAVRDLGGDVRAPSPATDVDLLAVHTAAYIDAVATGAPRALAESQKFPWSPALAEAVRWTNGGCIAALAAALDDGVAGNLASGFHHAHADHGEGFCTFNGLVVAMEHQRRGGRFGRALVLDMDLHYGNGTASLLATRPWCHQLSIYGNFYRNNVAIRDVTADADPDTDTCRSVAVPAGTDGARYLETLSTSLGPAIDRAKPDVLIYQAGADPLRDDPYSPLDLGLDDLLTRDLFVFETARARGLPVMWVLAGGYTPDVRRVVDAHVNTWRAAAGRA